jgi:antirestriction protein ArdC
MDKKSIHQEVTDAILELLERGTLPWRRTWKTQGGFTSPIPANGISGRPYRGINRVILWASAMARGYPTHAWATYRQVSQAGGHVKKDERGTHVVLYRPLTVRGDADLGEATEEEQGTRGDRTVRILRAFTVFNLAQCEGLPEPPEPVAPPVDVIPQAQRFLANVGATVQHGGNSGFYWPKEDRIQLPSFDAFSSPEAYFATSLHEHVHWTGHESRLKRLDKGAKYGSASYAYEELVVRRVGANEGAKMPSG